VDFAHGRGASKPEHAKNLKFRSGGFLWSLSHAGDNTTKAFVVSTKIFVDAKVFLATGTSA
jgi:hypothetical protein